MNVVHFCNNYVGTKIHLNQVKSLSEMGHIQDVFIPVYSKEHCSINNEPVDNVSLHYKFISNKYIKYFPLLKVLLFMMSFFVLRNRVKNSDVIYAHTLWSNGIAAYLFSVIYSKPLIISIRSADYFVFLPKLPHYRWLIKLALKRASDVIFISPSYRDKVMESYPNIFVGIDRISVVPNGIDDFWLSRCELPIVSNKNNVISFVGRLNSTKRPELVVKAVDYARRYQNSPELTLNFYGCDTEGLLEYLGWKLLPDWINVKGKVAKESIFEELRLSRYMVVPSYQETFGLVYLEALSCGCSIILSKGEGISGFFPNHKNIIELESFTDTNLGEILAKELEFDFERSQIPMTFSWGEYAKKVNMIFKNCIS
ncbi:glycosyltransferase [Vibrio cyclitrophicus]